MIYRLDESVPIEPNGRIGNCMVHCCEGKATGRASKERCAQLRKNEGGRTAPGSSCKKKKKHSVDEKN